VLVYTIERGRFVYGKDGFFEPDISPYFGNSTGGKDTACRGQHPPERDGVHGPGRRSQADLHPVGSRGSAAVPAGKCYSILCRAYPNPAEASHWFLRADHLGTHGCVYPPPAGFGPQGHDRQRGTFRAGGGGDPPQWGGVSVRD